MTIVFFLENTRQLTITKGATKDFLQTIYDLFSIKISIRSRFRRPNLFYFISKLQLKCQILLNNIYCMSCFDTFLSYYSTFYNKTHLVLQMQISNIEHTTRPWNNLHRVRSKSNKRNGQQMGQSRMDNPKNQKIIKANKNLSELENGFLLLFQYLQTVLIRYVQFLILQFQNKGSFF